MEVSYEFKWNPKTYQGLQRIPDTILYEIARETLNFSVNDTIIPKDTGTMERQSLANGVRGGNGDFYIKSSPEYASSVWVMPESTNWTTPGTNNKWFARALKRHSATIISEAVNKGWRKEL